MDETFGLIETVEKAAQIYMLTAHMPRINTIKDSEMQELAEFFGVKSLICKIQVQAAFYSADCFYKRSEYPADSLRVRALHYYNNTDKQEDKTQKLNK